MTECYRLFEASSAKQQGEESAHARQLRQEATAVMAADHLAGGARVAVGALAPLCATIARAMARTVMRAADADRAVVASPALRTDALAIRSAVTAA